MQYVEDFKPPVWRKLPLKGGQKMGGKVLVLGLLEVSCSYYMSESISEVDLRKIKFILNIRTNFSCVNFCFYFEN